MKRAKTRLRAGVPQKLTYRLRAARATGSAACLWRPIRQVQRRWAEARYRDAMGKPLELDPPRTFTHKLHWRLLRDRRPLWRLLRDKYRVRSFVRSRVGEKHLIPLLHETRTPSTIPFDRLDAPYIVKPTHVSGVVYIVQDDESLDAERRREIVEDLYWYLATRAFRTGSGRGTMPSRGSSSNDSW